MSEGDDRKGRREREKMSGGGRESEWGGGRAREGDDRRVEERK